MDKGNASEAAKENERITTTANGIPSFSGEDAYLWVSRMEQYFKSNPTMTDQDKFQAAIAALEGHAFNWKRKKYTSTSLTWSSFKDAVLNHFEPVAVRYPLMALLNLRQMGSVAEYCDLFETLCRSKPLRHINLSDEISMAIFLRGLTEDLREDTRLHGGEVNSLLDLMNIAKIIEVAENEVKSKLPPNPWLKFWGEISPRRKVIILVYAGAIKNWIERGWWRNWAYLYLNAFIQRLEPVYKSDDDQVSYVER